MQTATMSLGIVINESMYSTGTNARVSSVVIIQLSSEYVFWETEFCGSPPFLKPEFKSLNHVKFNSNELSSSVKALVQVVDVGGSIPTGVSLWFLTSPCGV